MTEIRDNLIRQRNAFGQKHKSLWLARTAVAVAEELDCSVSSLKLAIKQGKPAHTCTQEMLDYAAPIVAEGVKHYELYIQHSPQALRQEFHIGEHTFRRIIAEGGRQESDPVRRFLTMKLRGEPA